MRAFAGSAPCRHVIVACGVLSALALPTGSIMLTQLEGRMIGRRYHQFDDDESAAILADPDRDIRDAIARLELQKEPIRGAYREYMWTGLILLRIGRARWFIAPWVLLALAIAAFYVQAAPLAFACLAALVVIGFICEGSVEDWVDDHNRKIDKEIAALQRRLRSEPEPRYAEPDVDPMARAE